MGFPIKWTVYEANGKIFNIYDRKQIDITDRPEMAFFLGGKCLAACDPDWK